MSFLLLLKMRDGDAVAEPCFTFNGTTGFTYTETPAFTFNGTTGFTYGGCSNQ